MPALRGTTPRTRTQLTQAQNLLVGKIRDAQASKASFTQPAKKGEAIGREMLPMYWHPERVGVKLAPESFRRRLKDIHVTLDATWHPLRQRWLIWARKPAVQNPVCPGWNLIFLWEHPVTNEYLPLNELVFLNLYQQSKFAYPNAEKYFESIMAKLAKQKADADATLAARNDAFTRDYLQHTKIKSIGKGSKFVNHHQDGVAGKYELAERARTAEQRLPKEWIEQAKRDQARRQANYFAGLRALRG